MIGADASATDYHANDVTDSDPRAILATAHSTHSVAATSLGRHVYGERGWAWSDRRHRRNVWRRFGCLWRFRSHRRHLKLLLGFRRG